MDLPLPRDFREFLALLTWVSSDPLIVGGYSLRYHGFPRPTK
jgi:hypothetical protein